VVRRAADALGVAPERLVALDGASGQTWGCGDLVLRLSRPDVLAREAAAMAAASAALPVPRVLEQVVLDDGGHEVAAVLLTRLPGRPAGDLTGVGPEQARRRGEACGAVHAALASIAPPAGLEDRLTAALVSQHGGPPASPRSCLLHLDLHPFNVLVDAAGQVSGVVDWANTAAGPAVAERARTWSILTLDPSARLRQGDPRWRALTAGWTRAAALDDLPPAARAWACRTMLDDLSRRFDPDALLHVRVALRTSAGTG
jgi:aminoglycoside phosphotransferase (APT) family kinase protein